MRSSLVALCAASAFACTSLGALSPALSAPAHHVRLHVDASHAVQGLLRVHETIDASAGPLTLVYPKWLPGEHAPNGPIANVVGLALSANGKRIAWTRDLVDLYAFHLDVPPGASAIDADFTFLGGAGAGDTARLATPAILTLEWNKVALTPQAGDDRAVEIAPSITLPSARWTYATALESTSHQGADVAFAPVTLEQLVDSPLDAGVNAKTWQLGAIDGAPVSLAAFADTEDELAASDATIAKLRKLVEQMHALYRYRHFAHYTFLLTLSDVMPGEGLEHHQSSDDGTRGNFFTSANALVASGDLLPHEFNHSWDGKYRRPADLATPNFNVPMIDDLLWVYEGMTQFYGELQAERAGLRTKQQWLDGLASTYARLDAEPGRLTNPLLDTASASSILRGNPVWYAERRGQDYYSEGALMWLQADVLIRTLSHDKKSLDDVARAFFGNGHDTGPQVDGYTREDLIAALNAVQPYDWRAFFARYVDTIMPHPPSPFEQAGYRVTFTDKPNDLQKIYDAQRHTIDTRYSLGIVANKDGQISDVISDSPAFAAGVGPGEKIVAVDDRAFTGTEQLDTAMTEAKTNGAPIRLLLSGGSVYRTVSIAYRGGPRYPHLERIADTPDVLSAIAKPL